MHSLLEYCRDGDVRRWCVLLSIWQLETHYVHLPLVPGVEFNSPINSFLSSPEVVIVQFSLPQPPDSLVGSILELCLHLVAHQDFPLELTSTDESFLIQSYWNNWKIMFPILIFLPHWPSKLFFSRTFLFICLCVNAWSSFGVFPMFAVSPSLSLLSFLLSLTLSLSFSHTHTHTNTYTHRGHLQNRLP